MNAVRAEWVKLRTTPGPWWLLALLVALLLLLPAGFRRYVGQAPVALLGVLMMGGDPMTVALAAVPRRPLLLASKAAVLATAVATVVALCWAVRSSGPGTAAYLVPTALLSLGLAAVVKEPAAAIGSVLGLLYLPPLLIQLVADPQARRWLEAAAPTTAGWGALVAWAAGALLAGSLALRARDA